MFNPKVSIIIPVYNGTNYMREAIDSALNQTYQNKEIIVINDGSRDDGATYAVAKAYGDKIKFIDKENGGVATALNAGIATMSGDYFSWLSHDDVYPNDKIQIQVDYLRIHNIREVILFGDYTIIDAQSKMIGKVSTKNINTDAMVFELYAYQTIHGCSLLIPKNAFDQCGLFREDLPTTQDYDLWLRMSQKFEFVRAEGTFVHSRQHAEQGSRTQKHRKEALDFFIKNLEILNIEYLDKAYPQDKLKAQYKILLKKFSAPYLWPVYFKVLNQSRGHIKFEIFFGSTAFSIQSILLLYFGTIKGFIKEMIPLSLKNILRKNLNAPSSGIKDKPATLDFINIYQKNIFGSKESRSGSGSTMKQTAHIRAVLPEIFKEMDIQSILDVPCGDFNWMKEVNLNEIKYIGGDIVPKLIEDNNQKYGSNTREFRLLNIITDDLPKTDVIFCRDCLVHLKFEDGLNAIKNFKKSGSKYLLATTFTDRSVNEDLFGIWRTLNLQKPPFNLPTPIMIINEKCTEGRGAYKDKSLGLWALDQIDV